MSGATLNSELLALLTLYPKTRRILIAYSGGLDSRVLLHLVAENRATLGRELAAIHIDHGLQSNSTDWARQCVQNCKSYAISCHVLDANLKPQSGESIEALAREKRYELFASIMREHDILLLAQHADDQAETVVLQLLRGAGPQGLAAMPVSREFAKGHLLRPLLQFSRADLEAYAHSQQLTWIEDPSNADDRFDRNYLRLHILPLIEKRFPSYRKTLARSAGHCAELVAQTSVDTERNYQKCLQQGSNILALSALSALSQSEQKQVLRRWIKNLGFHAPQSHQLSLMLEAFTVENAAPKAAVSTSTYQLRRYQNGLYLLDSIIEVDPFHYCWADITVPLYVPELSLELSQQSVLAKGLKLDPKTPAEVRSRQAGEKLRTEINSVRKSSKNLFQESAIPPWERDKYPFIYQNDKLVAILGLAVDPEFRGAPDQSPNTQTETNTADS